MSNHRVATILLTAALSAPLTVSAQEPATGTCTASYTVFQDVSAVGRKDGAAKNMTRKHSEMALQDWRFVDMEIYTENGDLEGFFLTYSKDLSCDKIPHEKD